MTVAIRVIEHEERCGWCDIRIGADGLPPVRTHHKAFHAGCIGPYAVENWQKDVHHRRMRRWSMR